MIQLTIVSPEQKRREIEVLKLRKQAERQAYEALRPLRIEKMVETIFNTVKKEIEQSESDYGCWVTIWEEKLKGSYSEKEEAIKIVEEMFNSAGYEVFFHYYSQSWQTRTGKFGYFHISWFENK